MTFTYPAPEITTRYEFETLHLQRITEYVASYEAFRIANPDLNLPHYNLQQIQSDPAVIGMRPAALGDMFFIDRTNAVARAAVLVDFAKGSDLDLHGLDTRVPGHPDGVIRHTDEGDEDYKARIIEARAGASAAGPDEWWLKHARAADSRVRSIGLAYRGQGHLDIYLLSRVNGGVPDEEMLTAVRTRLLQNDVRPRTVVTLTVQSAVIEQVDVVADVWLHPEAAESRLVVLKSTALARHAAEQALDVDLTHHYLKRLLDAADVYKIVVVTPADDLLADPSRAYSIRSIDLRLAGRMR
jgi:phage-related baseplate assembly protein